jgi:hypothetical protein
MATYSVAKKEDEKEGKREKKEKKQVHKKRNQRAEHIRQRVMLSDLREHLYIRTLAYLLHLLVFFCDERKKKPFLSRLKRERVTNELNKKEREREREKKNHHITRSAPNSHGNFLHVLCTVWLYRITSEAENPVILLFSRVPHGCSSLVRNDDQQTAVEDLYI